MFGIAVILGNDGAGHTPCGCGECDCGLDIEMELGKDLDSDWLVHYLVPAAQFWQDIGYT